MRTSNPIRVSAAICTAACLLACVISPLALADGPPLILNSQTGIDDGQSGMVLQNAPLSTRPMVEAPQLEQQPNGQPPVIIAPIQLPATGASSAHAVTRMHVNSVQ